MSKQKIFLRLLIVLVLIFICTAGILTYSKIEPFSDELPSNTKTAKKPIFLDRYGKRLNTTYENRWNLNDKVEIHDIAPLLKNALVVSEDKRFFSHSGMDWLARAKALWQNISSFRVVRGASTISEQVVRMIHPRKRTFSSRWIEGFEAINLENSFSKLEILEFYLNQVPYQARRRGIVQAAHYYFDRDIDTLSSKEILALVVLVRSPKWLDPSDKADRLNLSISNLLNRMYANGYINQNELRQIQDQKLVVKRSNLTINAQHFIEFVSSKLPETKPSTVYTSLDAQLQTSIQNILDTRLETLVDKNVDNAAVLVIDHHTNEIISWVVAHAGNKEKAFSQMNPVLIRRQPGSALKPFLYAKAIEKGWSAATLIDDSPLQEGVGLGMHTYHNYSRGNYGLISVREALGNSLNIPAIKAVQYVGAEEFLKHLREFGIESLRGHPNVYGDGIALGNGEVSLYELTQAYSVFARMGDFKALNCLEGRSYLHPNKRVFSEDISSLISDILSDPAAREKEFGWNSILNFPFQTAVKTGTSSDYRDAWSMGYNDKYTVGIWFGNLDYRPMNKITGASGPAHVLRSIFNELNKNRQTQSLYLSPRLVRKKICLDNTGLEHDGCEVRDELFLRDYQPGAIEKQTTDIRLRKPTNGLLLAMDPRIPDEDEYFSFELSKIKNIKKVEWYINHKRVAQTAGNSFNWKVEKGVYHTKALVWLEGKSEPVQTKEIRFIVQ